MGTQAFTKMGNTVAFTAATTAPNAEQAEALPTIAKPNNPVRMWAGD